MLFPSIYLTQALDNTISEVSGSPARGRQERRGAVLLIVLVILTIMATLGLAFMVYAESEAVSAAAFKTQAEFRTPDLDPEMACSMFLQQFLFDCRDDASGMASALRGHSLYRNMYGLNYNFNPDGTVTFVGNTVPFNGTGRLHWTYGVTPGGSRGRDRQIPSDDYDLPNYTNFFRVRQNHPRSGAIRLSPTTGAPPTPDPRRPYIGGANPPYTAADMNAMYLAAVRADGTILAPSYHRDMTPIGFGSLDPNNPYWYGGDTNLDVNQVRYAVLRPRPADHPSFPSGSGKQGFSAPEDKGGDVRNRPHWWPPTATLANNDSIWLNIGAPVMTMPDGRKYTFLCAPLIIDLDGKLNINVIGNTRGKNNTTAGNQGFGLWEINPAQLTLNDTTLTPAALATAKAEWANLFNGQTVPGSSLQRLLARYGATKLPGNTGNAAPSPMNGKTPHFYAKIDYDGTTGWTLQVGGTPTAKWTVPGPYQSWPNYTQGYENASTSELSQHPSIYNEYAQVGDRRIFPAGEMHKILRYSDTNTDAMHCDLWQLLPSNLGDPTNGLRKRNMITTLSFDRREVGMFPWLYNAQTPNLYQLTGFVPGFAGKPPLTPKGAALGTPPFSLFSTLQTANPTSRNIGKEYGATDWRGVVPPLPTPMVRLDLNRAAPRLYRRHGGGRGGPAGFCGRHLPCAGQGYRRLRPVRLHANADAHATRHGGQGCPPLPRSAGRQHRRFHRHRRLHHAVQLGFAGQSQLPVGQLRRGLENRMGLRHRDAQGDDQRGLLSVQQ